MTEWSADTTRVTSTMVAAVAIAVALIFSATSVRAAGESFWSDDFSSLAKIEASSNVTVAPESVSLRAAIAVRQGLVLNANPADIYESAVVMSPSVIQEASLYRMYYAGSPDFSTLRILRASSQDGTSWVRDGIVLNLGPPGSGEDVSVGYPNVLKLGSEYYMWYAGRGGPGFELFLATSTDGLNWTRQGLVLAPGPGAADSFQVYQPWVLYEDGLFRMWYTGSNVATASILYATSTEGRTWTKRGVALTPGPSGSLDDLADQYPSVVRTPDGYHMWHSCTRSDRTDVLCLATSPDGVNWTKRGLVLDFNLATGETRNLILGTVIARAITSYDLWYAGRGDAFRIFRASLDRAFAVSGWIRSTPIVLPENRTWSWLEVRADAQGTESARVDVLDARTGGPILGFVDLGPGNRSLLGLSPITHPVIKLNATLTSSNPLIPVLQSWAVGWALPERPPTSDWAFIIFVTFIVAGASFTALVWISMRKPR